MLSGTESSKIPLEAHIQHLSVNVHYPVLSDMALFFFITFIHFLRERQRQRQSVSRGGAERERESQNLEQAPDSELSAQSPMWGSNSQTGRS